MLHQKTHSYWGVWSQIRPLHAVAGPVVVVETARGAALMACEPEADPGTLRRNVTSPGGTTEAALRVMREENLSRIVDRALGAAKERAEALATEFGSKA